MFFLTSNTGHYSTRGFRRGSQSANGVMRNSLTKEIRRYKINPPFSQNILFHISRLSLVAIMSRPVLSSATYRLSRHPSHSPAVSVRRCHRLFSTPRTAPSISASLYSGFVSRQPATNTLGASGKPQTFRNRLPRSSLTPFAAPRQRYAFSSSSARPGARVVQNPRTDDDGNELMVSISSRAAEVR